MSSDSQQSDGGTQVPSDTQELEKAVLKRLEDTATPGLTTVQLTNHLNSNRSDIKAALESHQTRGDVRTTQIGRGDYWWPVE